MCGGHDNGHRNVFDRQLLLLLLQTLGCCLPASTIIPAVANPAALQDFSDDPRDANPTVYMLAELVSVVLHTLFIWLLPMPLFVIAFGE